MNWEQPAEFSAGCSFAMRSFILKYDQLFFKNMPVCKIIKIISPL
jgi:hypothetical protein